MARIMNRYRKYPIMFGINRNTFVVFNILKILFYYQNLRNYQAPLLLVGIKLTLNLIYSKTRSIVNFIIEIYQIENLLYSHYTNHYYSQLHYRRNLQMAFVYRTPRHLNNDPPQFQTQQCVAQNDTQDKQNVNIKPKQPIKGLTQKYNCKPDNQKQFYFVKDVQNMKQLQHKKSEQRVRNIILSQQKQQYFFKSKCKRDINLGNSTFQQTKQNISEVSTYENQNRIQNTNSPAKKLKQNQNNVNTKIEQKPKKQKNKLILIQKQMKQHKLPCLMNKQEEKSGKNSMNLLHSKKRFNLVYTIPSIPGKDEQFGYVVKKDQLSYPTMVSKPRFDGQKGDMPGPTDYNICHYKKIKGVLKFSHPKHKSQLQQSSNDFYALVNDQQTLKMHNQKIKKWIKEGKQTKQQKKKEQFTLKERQKIQTRELSTASDESGQTVYQFDTTPGPGYYGSCSNLKQSYRSRNQKFQKIFISQSQRFQDLQQSKRPFSNSHSVYQTDQWNEQKYKNKRNKFFISKLQRNTNLANDSIAPSPGHYDIRISMQNDLITKILKNSPNSFSNKLPRLLNCVSSITPGPGAYCTDKPQFKIESFKPDFSKSQTKNVMKSIPFSSLKLCEKILLENSKQVNQIKRIHHCREDSVIQCQNFAPFLSTSPKGLNIYEPSSNDYKKGPNFDSFSAVKVRMQNQVKQNIYPFNSSQVRNKDTSYGYIAEVGLYEVKGQQDWDKKSFNVLFN